MILERRGLAAWITINRANRGNSFRRQTLDEITDALVRVGDAPNVRVVVLTAAGQRFFSTGGDVGDYWTRYRDDMVGMRAYERAMEKTFSEMIHCPKPIIHRINGDCVGGANAFHLAADLAVMSTAAKLQQVGTTIGSVGGFGPTQWWPQVVGDKRARDILLCCKPVDAELALQWGVVNAIAPYDQLDAAVQVYVDKLAKGFPDAMRYSQGLGQRTQGACLPRDDAGARVARPALPVDGVPRGLRRLLREAAGQLGTELEGRRLRVM